MFSFATLSYLQGGKSFFSIMQPSTKPWIINANRSQFFFFVFITSEFYSCLFIGVLIRHFSSAHSCYVIYESRCCSGGRLWPVKEACSGAGCMGGQPFCWSTVVLKERTGSDSKGKGQRSAAIKWESLSVKEGCRGKSAQGLWEVFGLLMEISSMESYYSSKGKQAHCMWVQFNGKKRLEKKVTKQEVRW